MKPCSSEDFVSLEEEVVECLDMFGYEYAYYDIDDGRVLA